MATETASPHVPESRASRQLHALLASGRPLLYVVSAEEERLAGLLRAAAARFFAAPVPLWSWSLTEGLRCGDDAPPGRDTTDPRAALDFVAGGEGPAVFHLKDFHEPLRESAAVRRRLRDVYARCLDHGRFVVISSPVRFIPDELAARDRLHRARPAGRRRDPVVPRRASRRDRGRRRPRRHRRVDARADDPRACRGSPSTRRGFALRRALAGGNRLDLSSLPALFEEKRLAVNRTGTIEFVADGGALDSVGGLEVMKKWLLERRRLFQSRDGVERGHGAEGRAGDGRVRLRQEPVGQGDRRLLRAAALPDRHGRDLLGSARPAGMGVRAGLPHDGGDRPGRRVVRRDRAGHHLGRDRPASRAASSPSS